MCRAIWVAILAATTDQAARLRRAAGPDAQVILLATGAEEILGEQTTMDVVIVDGSRPDAAAFSARLRETRPEVAILVVGGDDQEAGHHVIPWESLEDALPGAITRALIARSRSGRNA